MATVKPNIAQYPNGFRDGVVIRGASILDTYSGQIWYVDSAGAQIGDGKFNRPFATIDTAINHASTGDIILVKAGHTETLVAAGAITMDVAGVSIRGLGSGNNRPVLTFTPAAVGTANVSWTAANCSFENIVCVAGLDALTTPFAISGANAWIDIEWQDASDTVEAATAIAAATGASNLTANLRYRGFTTGNACVAPIILTAVADARINVDFYGLASTAVVRFATTSTNVVVTGYAYNSTDTTGVKLVTDGGSSLWYASIYSGAAGAVFSGGSGSALASDDITALNTVLGTQATSAATGAVGSGTAMMGYIKELVTRLGTELDTNTLGSILYGTGGIATFPAAAHPADAVSLAEALRSVWARNIAGINPLGTVIFVAASGGSDANAGTSPNAAKATVAAAITAAGAGGTIVLGPGTHSVDVSATPLTPLANQQFVSAIPSFGGAPRVVISNDLDDGVNIVVIDVDGTVWRDIEFRNITAATVCVTQVKIADTSAVRGTHFENCWFNMNGLDGAMVAVNMADATNATTGVVFKHCRFTGGTGTTSSVKYIQVGIGGCPSGLFEENIFECQSADNDARAFDFLDPGTSGKSYGVTIRYNDIIGPSDNGLDAVPLQFAAAMTEGEIIGIIRTNYFSNCATPPIPIDLVNNSTVFNYGNDNATGGTLVDPGT